MYLFTPLRWYLYFFLTSGVWVYELRARRRPCPAALRLRAGLGGQAAHLRPHAGRLDQLRQGGQPQPTQSQADQSHSRGTRAGTHCKDTIRKIRNKCLQKRNCFVSVPISSLKCLWAIYIFPRSVSLFCCRKLLYVDRSWEHILYIAFRHMNVEIGNEAAQFLFWDFRCSAVGQKWNFSKFWNFSYETHTNFAQFAYWEIT